ncbi:MAG: cytochrome c3 family protein [Thermoanaerobaculales bacterium]|nr:cytochrome c3 family protein [Thermoanaerobaculales bacterium]
MPQPLKDARHLVRMAGLFLVAGVGFLVLRSALIPAGFGELGHYRSGALDDNARVEPRFAGRGACAECHDLAPEELAGGAHAAIGCEACHGPLAGHAADPDTEVPPALDTRSLCATCHAAEPAKPGWFPQVVAAEHAGDDACDECHVPHQPGV